MPAESWYETRGAERAEQARRGSRGPASRRCNAPQHLEPRRLELRRAARSGRGSSDAEDEQPGRRVLHAPGHDRVEERGSGCAPMHAVDGDLERQRREQRERRREQAEHEEAAELRPVRPRLAEEPPVEPSCRRRSLTRHAARSPARGRGWRPARAAARDARRRAARASARRERRPPRPADDDADRDRGGARRRGSTRPPDHAPSIGRGRPRRRGEQADATAAPRAQRGGHTRTRTYCVPGAVLLDAPSAAARRRGAPPRSLEVPAVERARRRRRDPAGAISARSSCASRSSGATPVLAPDGERLRAREARGRRGARRRHGARPWLSRPRSRAAAGAR